MALIGLSIFIASLSFICYKHPPVSWSFLRWLRRPSLPTAPVKDRPASAVCMDHDVQQEREEIPLATKEEQDRKAMPPPPPPFKRPNSRPPSPPTSPHASAVASSSVPTLTLDDSPPAPSFPALNSAQRASGGRRGPPRLNQVSALQPSTGLMAPPPMRSPLPNRSPSSSNFSSSSLALPPSHNSVPTKPRKKVLLTPGHSPLDWARLTSMPNANLRGLPASTPYLRVPPSLLRQYTGRKGKDAWTVLGGKVYNITPYLLYHPGGEPELMKAAGRDGTKLFGEVHPWVNWEGMLEGCMVGLAVDEGDVKAASSPLEEMD
jgi:cytochrome b involved in lipid metabolism